MKYFLSTGRWGWKTRGASIFYGIIIYMNKLIWLLLAGMLLTGCLKQHVRSGWEESNLTKAEYLKRRLHRVENEEADKGWWKRLLDPSW